MRSWIWRSSWVVLMGVIEPRRGCGRKRAEYNLPEGTLRFDFTGNDQELSQLLGRMMKADIPIVSFSEETGDLEDVFLHVTKGIVQ